jgi:hypothetical protein
MSYELKVLRTRRVLSLCCQSLAALAFAATVVVSTPRGAQAQAAAPAATVTCKDGTTSTVTGRGACSHHGGVDKTKSTSSGAVAPTTPATPAPAAAAAPAPGTAQTAGTANNTAMSTKAGKAGSSDNSDPTGAIAQCKDGLYSHSKHHSGTCARHGGVAKWLDGSK